MIDDKKNMTVLELTQAENADLKNEVAKLRETLKKVQAYSDKIALASIKTLNVIHGPTKK